MYLDPRLLFADCIDHDQTAQKAPRRNGFDRSLDISSLALYTASQKSINPFRNEKFDILSNSTYLQTQYSTLVALSFASLIG